MTPGRPLRVALFSELPTPYRWPVFRRLLESPDLDLRIRFCARSESDRQWTFDFHPDDRVRFLPAHTVSVRGRRTIHYHVNPTLFGELRRLEVDVVVLPGYFMFASQVGALWCRARGVPYVLFSETILAGRRRAAARVLKRLALPVLVGGASAWLATGRLSREYLISYGADETRIRRFPNTPDSDAMGRAAEGERSRRDELRTRYGAKDGPVVLFVARLLGVKRCDLLIDAVGRFGADGSPINLWVAGDGPDRAKLERLAARCGPARVRFFGNVGTGELPALYAAADAFVLPSDHEPWGAVVCEAAACGLPLILSDRVGAAPDLVEDGENGIVFPAGDAAALADALRRVLSDPDGLRRMGRRSAARAGAFTHRECAEQFLDAVRIAHRHGGCT